MEKSDLLVMDVATFTNSVLLDKTDKARKFNLNGVETWIPFSVVNSVNPGQRTVTIETWWLIKNNISFKV